jgi:dihydropyrimidinase
LKNGLLSITGSDHCTWTFKQKLDHKDFTGIPNGINGIEDRMNIIFSDFVNTGKISLQDYVR